MVIGYTDTSVVERALQLARSGPCKTITELKTQLTREGYGHALRHLAGPSIRRQLIRTIKDRLSGATEGLNDGPVRK